MMQPSEWMGREVNVSTIDDDTDASSEGQMPPGFTGVPLLRGKKVRQSRWGAPKRWPFVDETALSGVLRPPFGKKKPWDDGFSNTWNNQCHLNLRSYFDRARDAADWGRPTVPGQLKVTWMLNGPMSKELPPPPTDPLKRRKSVGTWRSEPRDPVQKKILASSLISLRKPRKGAVLSSSTGTLPSLPQGTTVGSAWSSSVPKSPWCDEFQHTYGNRFNGSVHKDFRQYFGAQSLHGALLPDVMGGGEHGMKELMY